MKRFIPLLLASCLLSIPFVQVVAAKESPSPGRIESTATAASAPIPMPLSAAWLEEGCVATEVNKAHERAMTDRERSMMLQITPFLEGFLTGAFTMGYLDPKNESGLARTPEGWDGMRATGKVLEFIRSHRDRIKPESDARQVLLAWFMITHPGATARSKAMGEHFLDVIDDGMTAFGEGSGKDGSKMGKAK